jgi:hypothetical protein
MQTTVRELVERLEGMPDQDQPIVWMIVTPDDVIVADSDDAGDESDEPLNDAKFTDAVNRAYEQVEGAIDDAFETVVSAIIEGATDER